MKCPNCGSEKVSRNGRRQGRQNHLCKDCGRQFIDAKLPRGYSLEVRQICLRMREKGLSFREIERLTGVGHNTIINWIRHSRVQMDEPEEDGTIQQIYVETIHHQFHSGS
jgi:transposase-like protein